MANPEQHLLLKSAGGDDEDVGRLLSNLLRDESLRLQRNEVERGKPSALDLAGEAGYAAVYSAVQAPVVGIAQIVDHATGSKIADAVSVLPAPPEEKFGTARWHAQQIGTAAGIVVPFALTRGAMKSTGLTVASRAELALASSGRLMSRANAAVVADGALTGFAMDFLMTPVRDEEGSFWKARVNNGLTGAATFGTLTAGSIALGRAARPFASELTGAKRIALDATLGMASGAPAGAVNADVRSLLTKGTFATSTERAQGAYTMAMVGGTLSAAHRIPGQDGMSPLEFQQRQNAKSNLESMLAERARLAKETSASNALLDVMPNRASESKKGSLEAGRAMASDDVIGEGKVVEAEVPAGLAPVLQKAINDGMTSSEATAKPTQVSQFIDYVRKEGAPIKEALLKIAKEANDQRFLTLVQEASLPPQGVELPARDYKIEPESGKPVTQDQLSRWQKFVELVANPPADSKGYSKFRQDMFDWLNANPDLHSWVKQFHKNSNHSKLTGPLDFYFETNELSRFVNVRNLNAERPVTNRERPDEKSAAEKPVQKPQERLISMDYLTLRASAREFARQIRQTPFDDQISQNFQALASKMKNVSVAEFALIINEELKAEKAQDILSAGVKGNEVTLYRPKTDLKMESIGILDCDQLPRQEVRVEGLTPSERNKLIYKIGNDFVKQLEYCDTAIQQQQIFSRIVLRLRDVGVLPGDMGYELNYVLRENNTPWTVMTRENNKLELMTLNRKEYKVPIVTAVFHGQR